MSWTSPKNKKLSLTSRENGCLKSLQDFPSYTLKLRGGTKSGAVYCLYDVNKNPVCTWPRGVIEGLIFKTYIDYTPETGIFIIL